MQLVDVHCHLNHILFKDDLKQVLERAQKIGLKAILVSGVNPQDNKEVLELTKKHEILKASLGIYPIDALGLAEPNPGLPEQKGPINLEEQFKFIEDNKEDIVAIGEIGMDFKEATKENTYNQQSENFRKIIQFAKKINKPIVIHSRKAEAECLEILQQELPMNKIAVNLHCFSGKKKLVKKAVELGYYFSIPPNCVKAQQFQMIIELTPITQLLTETDSPWPSHNNERNEPSNVIESIKVIAKIKNISVEEASNHIWDNYLQFLGEK
ncbi:TatD family hydrolase [Candidatus Woesearchaeota archaeon]|jgi:TatD DNase family protein|nr:TatD family hydrolase [Candidatus Woesearchaeota archaeon]MBT5740486.1 TatD family hydrolase [Candidatus Woesearchaeota archaeon]